MSSLDPSSPHAARILVADKAGIAEATALLKEGGLVAFPTETVYGLGANALDDRAVARIFAAKERPRFNPLIVHVCNRAAAEKLVVFNPLAAALADAFWPGALTLVLPRREGSPLSELVSAGLNTAAIRAPAHSVARALIDAAGLPIAAPSANRAGSVSPTAASHVAEDLGARVDLVLDGGRCPVGIESTVIGFNGSEAVLLRPGAITRETIEKFTGRLKEAGSEIQAPGMLASHYAPRARLRLNAAGAEPGEALLAFGSPAPKGPNIVRNLSARGDLVEAAANFFAMLRELDKSGADVIAVMPIPERGLGEAINDRLKRAAAPRTAP
jgi:L-threonylcarbamoyladenylate synthase